MKKVIIISTSIVAFLLIAFIVFSFYVHKKFESGELIRWNNKVYTQKQIEEMFPPQYVNAPAQNTPEEVYAKFREAILKDDIEGALSYIAEKNKERYIKDFADPVIIKKYKNIPNVSTLEKSELDSLGNRSIYFYKLNNDVLYLHFLKNEKGYWYIESI